MAPDFSADVEDGFVSDDDDDEALKPTFTQVQRNRAEKRRSSEISMHDFVALQLQGIMEPLIERLDKLERATMLQDQEVTKVARTLQGFHGAVTDASERLTKLNGRVDLTEGRLNILVDASDDNKRGLEATNQDLFRFKENFREFRRHLEDPEDGPFATMRRTLEEVEGRVGTLEERLDNEDHGFEGEFRRKLGQFGEVVQELRQGLESASAERTRLRADQAALVAMVREAGAEAEAAKAAHDGLQRSVDGFAVREARLSQQLNSWKDQWSKLHPELQATARDLELLKQRCDHHDAAIHGANQAHAHNIAQAREAAMKHSALEGEMRSLHATMLSSSAGAADLRKGLDEAVRLHNSLHTGMEDVRRLLRAHGDALDGLEKKHSTITADLSRTKDDVLTTRSEHAATCSSVRLLEADLATAKEQLSSTTNHVQSASARLDTLKGEFGKTKKAVDRLDQGMDFCRAGFSGLQKGLQSTGAHLASRTVVLPSLGVNAAGAEGGS